MYPDTDLQAMMSEASGPINFTTFLSIFGSKVAGKLIIMG